MTEEEWRAGEHPDKLAVHLHLHVRETGTVLRRSRLAAVACCHLIPGNVMPADGPALLAAVEAWVDAGGRRPLAVGRLAGRLEAEADRLRDGWRASRVGELANRRYYAATAVGVLAIPYRTPLDQHMILRCAANAALARPRRRPALATAAELVRCVFGNPFRAVRFDKRWRSETVVALATGVYAERAFDRLPVLADALEEAGCDHPAMLVHCRGPGPHARGCWVVDLVLGKS